MSRGNQDEYFPEAEQLYYESRRRSLVIQAEKGKKFNLQSLASQQFLDGVKFQHEGKLESAKQIFDGLVDTVDADGDQRHIHWESKSRVHSLVDGIRQQKIDSMTEIIELQRTAHTQEELETSVEKLSKILGEFGDQTEFQSVVDLAKEVLNENQKKLSELSTAFDS